VSALHQQRLPFTLNCELARGMSKFIGTTADDGGPVRYRIAFGGRGSIKSWTVARLLLLYGCTRKLLIVCAREYQKSIRESVHRLLNRQIQRLNLTSQYDVRETKIVNRWTGTEFIFVGLHHNIESIKSMEGINIVWVEEAETVSEESWLALDPTVREKGSEIWISFNPKEGSDPTWQRFIVNRMPGSIVTKVSWKDNLWLPEVLRIQAEWMREHEPETYEYVWEGGLWLKNDAQVLHGKWSQKDFTINPAWQGPYLGVDWGFSQDPTCMVKSYVDILNPEFIGVTIKNEQGDEIPYPLRRDLYIAEEAFAIGCETASIPGKQLGIADLFDQVSESRKYEIVADNARPETISHVVNVDGFQLMIPCEKWTDRKSVV
jgi:phage terminase large subunit